MIEKFVAVGVLVQGMRPVETRSGGRFDQQMGPAFVVGIVGQVESVGQAGSSEGEVALRVRPDRVQVDTER